MPRTRFLEGLRRKLNKYADREEIFWTTRQMEFINSPAGGKFLAEYEQAKKGGAQWRGMKEDEDDEASSETGSKSETMPVPSIPPIDPKQILTPDKAERLWKPGDPVHCRDLIRCPTCLWTYTRSNSGRHKRNAVHRHAEASRKQLVDLAMLHLGVNPDGTTRVTK